MSGNFEDHKMALLFRWTTFEIKNKTCQENESHIIIIVQFIFWDSWQNFLLKKCM